MTNHLSDEDKEFFESLVYDVDDYFKEELINAINRQLTKAGCKERLKTVKRLEWEEAKFDLSGMF